MNERNKEQLLILAGHANIVRLLLQHDADSTVRNDFNKTATIEAAERGIYFSYFFFMRICLHFEFLLNFIFQNNLQATPMSSDYYSENIGTDINRSRTQQRQNKLKHA